jgi:hypothetical protein
LRNRRGRLQSTPVDRLTSPIVLLLVKEGGLLNNFLRAWLTTAALCLSLAASAHHSTANFDRNTESTVTGVVKYFGFTNPHSFIDLEVKGAEGALQPYKIFTVGKVLMVRYGWAVEDLEPGDEVTVTGNPDRKDPSYMYLTKIVFASGKTWSRGAIPD